MLFLLQPGPIRKLPKEILVLLWFKASRDSLEKKTDFQSQLQFFIFQVGKKTPQISLHDAN